MSHELESTQRFSADATQAQVDKIIKHLGIALKSKDGSTVATSDQEELDRIRDGFCKKHLELDPTKADQLIEDVCEKVKHDSAKSRITFYYLLAESAGKLEIFS